MGQRQGLLEGRKPRVAAARASSDRAGTGLGLLEHPHGGCGQAIKNDEEAVVEACSRVTPPGRVPFRGDRYPCCCCADRSTTTIIFTVSSWFCALLEYERTF